MLKKKKKNLPKGEFLVGTSVRSENWTSFHILFPMYLLKNLGDEVDKEAERVKFPFKILQVNKTVCN